MKCTVILRGSFVMCVVAWLLPSAASQVQAITFTRDPMQGAGFVDVQGGTPLVLAAPG